MSETVGTPAAPRRRNPIVRYLARFDDGEIVRFAFIGLLAGSAAVLGLDVKALFDRDAAAAATEVTPDLVYLEPVLAPDQDGAAPSLGTPPSIDVDEEILRRPLALDLEPGGVLRAQGSIDIGAAARFAAEIEARGEYVRTVSLNSPGGSLDDALAISRLVREKGYDTEVADGSVCASSCPLVMAGGTERRAGEGAAIGLHQFYAIGEGPTGVAQAMSDAQATTARISRHLAEMGVDPALWLHALDTPPRSLYYLSREEMVGYDLVTPPADLAARQAPAALQ
jgi:hypothetical protein